MADSILKCPLCCDETFESRSALVEHLANILGNITCPICSNKWSSLGHLIEHLTLDNCEPDDETETIICDVSPQDENSEIVTENSECDFEELSENKLGEFIEKENTNIHPFPIEENQIIEDESEMGRMYVELLSKQLTKPCLRTQELKLVKDNGVSRYIIMTSEDSNMSVGSTVVTKQNTDGTISLTTVKDMKTETDSDTVITQDNDYEDTQEEIYSCNTCGISFTSVVDHIQNYHNDQDVVVEEPLEEDGSDSMPPMCYEPLPTEELSPDKHTRRMITDTGDIVETPVTMDIPVSMDASPPSVKAEVKEEAAERACPAPAPARTGRVRVGAPRDTVVVAPSTDSTNGPYHKVVVKEMRTTSGQTVKVYHCMSCGIYVSALDEFKGHPCKVLESDAQTSKIFKYRCPHCPVSYENSKSLCAHMKAHKPKVTIEPPPPLTSFECETCTTVFQTNKSLKLHKRMHDPVKARPLLPPVGSPEGSEVNHDKFLCPVCLKLIPTDYRTIHQNSHKNTDRFNCDVCNKKFTSNEYLEMHMTVHSIDKVVINKQDKSLPYTCVYCDRRFARPHEKVKHERIHTGEKPHRCDICGKSFRVSYCLTLHMRTHTGARPYACPHCDKRFKAHSVYNHHLLTHSEVRAYKCPYCPKAFKTSVQLAGHKNSHTKPFSCQHCNRPFASLYAVRVHTETHARQNNLRYSCTLCGASYARGFALRDHLRQVHKQEMAKAEGNKVTKIKEDEWIICTTDGDGANVPTVIEITKELPPEVQLMQA